MAFNIFFRGMPYVMTIDEKLPFTSYNGANYLTFAGIGIDGGEEGVLLEKLWGKINGNYELTASGW
jgi:hypothetical protein